MCLVHESAEEKFPVRSHEMAPYRYTPESPAEDGLSEVAKHLWSSGSRDIKTNIYLALGLYYISFIAVAARKIDFFYTVGDCERSSSIFFFHQNVVFLLHHCEQSRSPTTLCDWSRAPFKRSPISTYESLRERTNTARARFNHQS